MKDSAPRRLALALLPLLLSPAATPAAAPPRSPGDDLPRAVTALLQRRCASCHGSDGKAKGGFGHVLDLEKLTARGQVTPGRPADSPLYDRAARGEMPPGPRDRLSAEELALLSRWITAGAPGGGANPSAPANEAAIGRLVRDHLLGLEARDRRFARYLTLAHLNAPPGEVETHRQALAKLVNSLSWHPRLSRPRAIDPSRTVFHVDLRWYRWNARAWDRLTTRYPYRPSGSPGEPAAELVRLTGAESPVVRGDWFVATAARAAAYHDLLGLPNTDRALERLLQVDGRADLEEDAVARAGFNGSGVARNNRLLERHDALTGAYWRSYDFSENTGRQNLFERPLGPTPGPHGFVQAGGEMIFHLPNGLLGFLLVDADGRRVDRAPGEIVSDPKRPDRLVENGVSCLGCHSAGLIPKDDQVRPHVLRDPRAFPPPVRDAVRALYPPPARFRALVEGDNERFAAALKKLGVTGGEPEPISTVVLRFEGVLDLRAAAGEAGTTPAGLAAAIRSDGELTRPLGPLLARGTVQRPVFEELYPRLLALIPAGAVPEARTPAGPREAVLYRGHRDAVRALVWGPGGLVASAGDDRDVRVWEAETGKERAVLVGHADEVSALAFSPDGRRLASAGKDRDVRIWDVRAGNLSARLRGHTDAVRALAFSPDGRWLASAGADRTVRIWDTGTGREKACLSGHGGAVNALAVAPDGAWLASAGDDRVVRLWEFPSGRERGRWEGHAGAVQALAFRADGKWLASGGSDRTVRVWDAGTGRAVGRFDGHGDSVRALTFLPGSAGLLSGARAADGESAVRRWDGAGKEAGRGGPGPVGVLAFAPGGRARVTADGATVRVTWGE